MAIPTIHDQIAQRTIDLILQEPFYGHFFSGMLKELTEEISQLAISYTAGGLLKLRVNPYYWEKLPPKLQIGLIKHELLHLVLKHVLKIRQFEHKRLFYIAADLVVNQYIAEDQLSDDALLLQHFEVLELRPLQDVAYYYKRLLDFRKNIPQGATSGLDNSIQLLDDLLTQEDPNLSRHQFWEGADQALSTWDYKLLERSIDAQLRSTAARIGQERIGQLPGNLQVALKALEQHQSRMDWRRMLRLFVTASGKSSLKNTLHRPSKRYGVVPGMKLRRRQKLLIAIDTSASMSAEELTIFFTEIHHIWRIGAEITILESDTSIQNTYLYRGRRPEFVKGRGGTSYDAVIEWANKHPFLDGIIYYTDGYSALPGLRCRKPILWLITANGMAEDTGIWPNLPGRKIKLQLS